MRTHSHMTSTNADSFRRLEVITGVGRRRRWSLEDKARIVAESLDPTTPSSAVARRYGLHASQLFDWWQQLERSASSIDTIRGPAFVPVLLAEDSPAPAEAAGRMESDRRLSGTLRFCRQRGGRGPSAHAAPRQPVPASLSPGPTMRPATQRSAAGACGGVPCGPTPPFSAPANRITRCDRADPRRCQQTAKSSAKARSRTACGSRGRQAWRGTIPTGRTHGHDRQLAMNAAGARVSLSPLDNPGEQRVHSLGVSRSES